MTTLHRHLHLVTDAESQVKVSWSPAGYLAISITAGHDYYALSLDAVHIEKVRAALEEGNHVG